VEMRVVLEPDVNADAEDIERLGRQLRNELRSLDVDSVEAASSDEPPPGSKGPAVEAMTEWLVTLSASGGIFTTLIATVNDWLGRRAETHKVKITIDGDTLELSKATSAEQAELVKTFVRRHKSG
jgi:membrane-associated two-gene conflict system component 1 (EACC1)